MNRYERWKKFYVGLLVLGWITLLFCRPESSWGQERIALSIEPDNVLSRIDERIYSHFLEHIYHSVHGGLWDEKIWNRSFEEHRQRGFQLTQDGFVLDEHYQDLTMGSTHWDDYEFSLEVQPLEESSTLFVLFRQANAVRRYEFSLDGRHGALCTLGKRIRSNRARVLAGYTHSSFAPGRWYSLRVRCEQNHIRIWLNNQLIAEKTDLEEPYLNGGIGLEVQSGACRFRHVRVQDAAGQVLAAGRRLYGQFFLPRYWRAYGDVNWSVSNRNALNSDVCLHLFSRSDGAGIQQAPISVVKAETYYGSVGLRGTVPGGLVVCLRNGQEVLDEHALKPPTDSWAQYPFTLKPTRTSRQALLQVELRSAGNVWIDQISLMPETSRLNGGFHPGLLQSLADVRPPVLRWPGGRFVEWYRWKDAIGPQSARRVYPRTIWDDRDINALGIDEFIALCRLIGAEPYIVLNGGIDDSNNMGDEGALRQDALDLLEYCNGSPDSRWGRLRAKYGHAEPYRVKYWEIGDTHSYGTYDHTDRYIQRVETWSSALKAIDPTIAIIASGIFVRDDEEAAPNRRLRDVYSDHVDYVSLEAYERNDRFAQAPADWEAFLVQCRRDVAESDHPDLKVCVTEWNTGERDWRGGLYAAGMLNVFARNSDIVALASPAVLMRHTGGLAHDNALINFDHRGWFPSSVYVVMKLWRDFYLPRRIEISGQAGPLNVVAARSDDRTWLNIKMVNPSNQAVDVSARIDTDLSLRKADLWLIQADLRAGNTMHNADRIAPVFRSLSVNEKTVRSQLPAYSASIFSIRMTENTIQRRSD